MRAPQQKAMATTEQENSQEVLTKLMGISTPTKADDPQRAIPDESAQKIPKSIEKCREFLLAQGHQITAESVSTLPHALANPVTTLLRARLTGDQKVEYKALKDDSSKRDWLAQFIADPKVPGAKRGFNTHTAINSQEGLVQAEWLLESQIGGPKWLNDMALASELCRSGELDDQPSRFKCLAEKGVKEYRWSRSIQRKLTGWKDEAGCEHSAEINAPEFEQVRDAIKSTLKDGPIKKKPKKEPAVESVADKDLKNAVKQRNASLKAMKSLCDKIVNQLNNSKNDTSKLEGKGYPPQMREFLEGLMEDMMTKTNAVLTKYGQEVAFVDKSSAETVNESTQDIEKSTATLDADFQKLKKAHLVDLKKLAA